MMLALISLILVNIEASPFDGVTSMNNRISDKIGSVGLMGVHVLFGLF